VHFVVDEKDNKKPLKIDIPLTFSDFNLHFLISMDISKSKPRTPKLTITLPPEKDKKVLELNN
jgi:hypothetical protein